MLNQKVQLTDEGANLFPNPNLIGIDYSNIIASYQTAFEYTTQQDGVMFLHCEGSFKITIDGVQQIVEASASRSYNIADNHIYPIKKGQTIKVELYSSSWGSTCGCAIFGFKY